MRLKQNKNFGGSVQFNVWMMRIFNPFRWLIFGLQFTFLSHFHFTCHDQWWRRWQWLNNNHTHRVHTLHCRAVRNLHFQWSSADVTGWHLLTIVAISGCNWHCTLSDSALLCLFMCVCVCFQFRQLRHWWIQIVIVGQFTIADLMFVVVALVQLVLVHSWGHGLRVQHHQLTVTMTVTTSLAFLSFFRVHLLVLMIRGRKRWDVCCHCQRWEKIESCCCWCSSGNCNFWR